MKTNLINNKTAISTAVIALVVIVVVAAVAGAIYFAATQNKPSSPSATETPTPSATASQSPTPVTTTSASPTATTNPSASTTKVADASSLKYSVNLSADTPAALRGTYTYYGKNIGTSSFMGRIEFTDLANYQTIIILNGAQQKSWEYSGGKWTEISAYGTYNNVWQGYVGVLASWNGTGDYTYTLGQATVRIYDISVNPVLADSLFQHS
jgi:hypothetical protein